MPAASLPLTRTAHRSDEGARRSFGRAARRCGQRARAAQIQRACARREARKSTKGVTSARDVKSVRRRRAGVHAERETTTRAPCHEPKLEGPPGPAHVDPGESQSPMPMKAPLRFALRECALRAPGKTAAQTRLIGHARLGRRASSRAHTRPGGRCSARGGARRRAARGRARGGQRSFRTRALGLQPEGGGAAWHRPARSTGAPAPGMSA